MSRVPKIDTLEFYFFAVRCIILCIFFENVDKIKKRTYIIIMKFTVEKLPQAKNEIDSLEQSQKDMLEADYKKIQEQGIEFVRVKPIQKEIFEIKTNELRSLFKYKAGKIIVVGVVFVKKTQKTPKEIIKLAKKRLKEI
jgi:phage-related protein